MPNHEKTHTTPWHRDELCHVNGIPLVYRFSEHDEMILLLPGCGAFGGSKPLSISAARKYGYAVTLPKTVRREHSIESEIMG